MPKRSAQEKIRKLKDTQEQAGSRQVRCINDDEEVMEETDAINVVRNELEPEAGPSNSPDYVDTLESEQPTIQEIKEISTPVILKNISDAPLNPEILSALGASTSDLPEFGNAIHERLANFWTPLLKSGLPKDQKDRLMKYKDYIIPSNCKMLQAPKLNAEVSAAISDADRGRDKKIFGFQQQLGTGSSAINRAMDILIFTDNKVEALKYLSDGCRILADLHHSLTKDRQKLITPSLEKNFLPIIQETDRDDTLFGNLLSEKIKASQAIERQGSQIRSMTNRKSATVHTSVSRPAPQGNWTGPSRYPTNRGGRRGPNQRGSRVLPPRQSNLPLPATKIRSYYQLRPRAPARQ